MIKLNSGIIKAGAKNEKFLLGLKIHVIIVSYQGESKHPTLFRV